MDKIGQIIKHVLSEEDDFDAKDLTANDPAEPAADPYEVWLEKYRPIKNPLAGEGAAFDGTMFETYGPELEKVQTTPNQFVWTYVTGDNNEDIIVAGFHYVNRMGYFITENPWEDDSEAYQFGEGDPHDAASAAEKFIDYELGQNWKTEWTAMPPRDQKKRVAKFAEDYGLEGIANDIVKEISKSVAASLEREHGQQI